VIVDKCLIILTAALLKVWGLGHLTPPNGKYQMTVRSQDVAPQDTSFFFYSILNDTWMIAQHISLSQQQTLAGLSPPPYTVFFRIRIPLAVPLVQLVPAVASTAAHISSGDLSACHPVWLIPVELQLAAWVLLSAEDILSPAVQIHYQ